MDNKELRKLRLKIDVTQVQMADMLGVTRQTYGGYETGKQPLSKPVEKLAEMIAKSHSEP